MVKHHMIMFPISICHKNWAYPSQKIRSKRQMRNHLKPQASWPSWGYSPHSQYWISTAPWNAIQKMANYTTNSIRKLKWRFPENGEGTPKSLFLSIFRSDVPVIINHPAIGVPKFLETPKSCFSGLHPFIAKNYWRLQQLYEFLLLSRRRSGQEVLLSKEPPLGKPSGKWGCIKNRSHMVNWATYSKLIIWWNQLELMSFEERQKRSGSWNGGHPSNRHTSWKGVESPWVLGSGGFFEPLAPVDQQHPSYRRTRNP